MQIQGKGNEMKSMTACAQVLAIPVNDRPDIVPLFLCDSMPLW
jgi:hypothetical protein